MRARATLVMVFVLMAQATLVWQIGAAEGQVVEDGLVSYWTFDVADVVDTTVKDVWGGNDGTLVGDPEAVEGKIGQAL